MPLTTDLIEQALEQNAAGGTEDPAISRHRLAQAIVDTIKLGSPNYTVGLLDSLGSPVTGSLDAALIH